MNAIPELFIKAADTITMRKLLILIIGIFYPSGEPISLQSLRCSPLEVVHYVFEGHFLAFAATSVRE